MRLSTRSRTVPFISLIAASALALTGCAGATSAEVGSGSGTTNAGVLTIYAGRDEALISPLLEMFTAETGIAVDVRYGTSPELAALLIEEGDRSPANVFLSQDAGALGALSTADLLAGLPNDITEVIPQDFSSTNSDWVGVTGRARVIAYDSQKIAATDVPDSVLELTAPQWSGRVGFPPGNASFQSFVTALRVIEGETVAEQWVSDMAANSPVLTEKNGATLDLVNSGQLDIALINHYYWYQSAAELGVENMRAQLKFLPGDAGGIVNVTGAGIMKGSASNAEALQFLRFLISSAAQQYFVNETFEYPLLPGIDAPVGLPSLSSLANVELNLDDLESLSDTQRMLAKHGLL
ncbi:iron ABC transporter substrate-binding protein [Alpinimonas psychrophila]|uniref:Iron(III) transport system substrate-binding protein n=1 Tax=Alpinimonas psychrophila TaxID=748908 RepID=A0A7W3JSJ1_9MICO|nr:extracellular solute-binding protein [Alpinimonas psychrophila]MBA8828459.1 iron(III) transport system substrate-binding protein [Alpinimonas psychrophila]